MFIKRAGFSALCTFSVIACGSTSSTVLTGQSEGPVTIEPRSIASPSVATALAETEATASLNASSDKQMNLLVRLYLDDGNMVQFYEPAPGHLLLVGVEVGGEPFSTRVPGYQNMLPVAIFNALEPGVAVPSALAAAQARAQALATTGSLVPQSDGGTGTPSASASTATVSPGPTGTGSGVAPLDCGSCTNQCDYSCWSCRACVSGAVFDWCYANAYNGADANNGGSTAHGWGDICSLQGDATLTITSNIYDGNYTVGPQQECWEWSFDNNFCLFDPVFTCTQNINFAVSGSNIDVEFGGYFD